MRARSLTGVATAAVLWLLLVPGAGASSQRMASGPLLAADVNPVIWTSTGTMYVTLRNVGTGTLTFSSTGYPAPASGWIYSGGGNCVALSLGPGGTCTVPISFVGVGCGVCVHTVTATSNGGNITVQLLNGANTVPDLSTHAIGFGNEPTGSTSSAQTLTVANDSGSPMTLSTFDTASSDFSVSGGTCALSHTIAAGDSCTVDYVFSPSAEGTRTGSFRIGSSSGTSTVFVSGTGVPAGTDTTPPTITASATSNGSPYVGGTWTRHSVVVHFTCSDADSGVASVSSDQTVSSEGAGQSVTGTCSDNAGNAASATFSDIQIDTTAPAIGASTGTYVPGTVTNQPVTVHFDCTDGGSGVASVTGDQTVSANGTGQSVTGTCTDNAGNSTSATVSDIDIAIDTTPPTISASAGSYVSGTWTNAPVTVHFDCTDASGVASLSPDQTVASEGAGQSVTGTCTDNAGNSASATFDDIQIDTTPPSAGFVVLDEFGNPVDLEQWSATPLTVYFQCTDALSGVASVTAPTTLGDGADQSASGDCADNAGNSASTTVSHINIDTQPPAITASAGAYVAGTWTKDDVTVHFDCTDIGSGVASVSPDQTVSTDGAGQSVTGTCTDAVGNSASATFANIQIDKTAPALAVTALDGNADPYVLGDWSPTPIMVHVNCSDPLSDVASVTPSATFGDGANQSFTATCVDNAGNSSQQTLSGINVDMQAPSITASASSNGSPYAGGAWTNHDVVVHFTCTDGGSGVATVTTDQTLSSDGDSQSVTGTCTDHVNRSASATFTGIRIDKTAPTVTYTGNNGLYGLNDTVSIHCASSDATSGVASDTCADVAGPAWSFGAGSHTYSASATDNAGNSGTGSATFTVTVTFAGLEALVSQFCTNPGVANGLNAKLDAASAAKARGQTKTEQNQLSAFGNQVNAQTGKCLTPAQAGLLLQFASAL